MKPLNRKRPNIFFGWWIVGASFFVALYTAGAITYGFTAVFEPVVRELGWSYAQVSLAASLRGVEVGLIAPLSGIIADRWGPRKLIFGSALLISAALIILSQTVSLGMFYAAFVLVGIGMTACGTTVLMTAITYWFRRKAGLAVGIADSGYGFGGLLIPLMVKLIEVYEWRLTMVILALGMLATIVPLSLLFRHKPEHYGYLPDGDQQYSETPYEYENKPPVRDLDVKAKDALRSSVFWRMAVTFIFLSMVLTTTITHVMPYLSSIGVARSTAGLVASAIPLLSIGGRLGLSWLGDRFCRRSLYAVALAMASFGLLCFGYAATGGPWLLVPFLFLFGIGYGGCNALRPSLVREYFGRTNFGTVFGMIIGIATIGNIIGPPLAGLVYDYWGAYMGIWAVFACLILATAACMMTIPKVRTSG